MNGSGHTVTVTDDPTSSITPIPIRIINRTRRPILRMRPKADAGLCKGPVHYICSVASARNAVVNKQAADYFPSVCVSVCDIFSPGPRAAE